MQKQGGKALDKYHMSDINVHLVDRGGGGGLTARMHLAAGEQQVMLTLPC